MNLELLPSNELFISIIQLKQPYVSFETNVPNNVISIIHDITQKINSQPIDLKALRKILPKDGSDVFKIGLEYINFSIDYSLDLVQTLAIVNFSDDESKYAVSYLSLYIFLQFMSTKNFNDTALTYIFQMFNKQARTKDTKQLIVSSFIILFEEYIDSNFLDSSESVLKIIFDFYSQNLDLPKQSYFVLGKTALKLFIIQESSVSPSEIEFFSFIDMIAIERSTFFPNEVIETCIKCMSISLGQLDLFSTKFFTHFTDRLSTKFSSKYFEIFPLALSSVIMEKPPLTQIDIDSIEDSSSEYEIINEKNSIKPSSSKSGIEKEIDFETSFVLPENHPITDFIQIDVLHRVDLIVKATEQIPELIKILVDHFTPVLKKMNNSPYIFDLLAIIFEITSHFLPVYDVISLFDTINESPLFNQKINILSNTESYRILSSFRSASFDFCCRNDFLSEFINNNVKKPFILAEYIQRIIQTDFVLGDKQKTAIVKSLINAELQFQKLLFDNKGIQIARATIFVLLSRFLTNQTFSIKFFNDDWFCTVFILSFLFEKSLQSFVLSSSRRNLIIDEGKSPKVIRNYANAIEIASASLPSEDSLDLINKVVSMLIDVASAKPSMIEPLMVIREKIAKTLSILANLIKNSEENVKNTVLFKKSEDFFTKSIQFFTQISSSHFKTSATFVSAFESIGEALYSTSIPEQFFGKVVQLISGSLTPSFESNFIVREPKFVLFFLKFFRKNSVKYIESLSFMNKLCEFSRENCILCHKEKVDSYLVDVLVSMKEKYDSKSKFDDDIIEKILSLLCSIVSVVSSVSFVHQCFSLFTPVWSNKVKSISLLQPKFINTISQIINKTGNNPSASFPLLSNGSRIQFSLDQSLISKGFSFVFWICIDSLEPQYMPQILTISDNVNQKITLFLKSNNLMFQIKTKKTSSTGIFEKCIPLRSWSYVNINFLKDETSQVTDDVFISINQKNVKDLYYPKINLNNGQIKFTIGGTTEDSTDSENPALLATFGLFQLLEIAEINFINELGPKLKDIPISMTKINITNDDDNVSIDNKLLIMIRTTNLNNQLKLDFVSTDSNPRNFGHVDMNSFNFIPSEVIKKQNPSFTNVLLSSVKVDNLIPLFSQHDLNYVNGESYSPQCEELSLLVLGSVLASSIDAQYSMFESNGFEIICHLFMASNSYHYTYKLYTKFFNLYQTCSYIPLQQQIFHNMLFNFDLLMKASPANDHLMILKHWNRSLFPAALSHKIERISFKQVIIGLVSYYWNVPPQYRHYPRNDKDYKLNVDKCRKCLIDISYQVAQFYFDDDDLNALISFIVNSNDDVLLDCLLTLLKSLVLMNNNVFKNDLSLIFYLFNNEEESIIASTIDLLILMINNKVINNLNLAEMVDIIIRQISPDVASEILLQHIITLMIDGSYELLSICIYFAFILGIERLNKFIHSIQPSSLYCHHFSWSFWPIVICYHLIYDDDFNDEYALVDEILSFLFKCGFEQWINIIVMIDFVGQVLSVSSSDLKSRALLLLCDLVLKSTASFEDMKNFCLSCIQLTIRFLFFRNEAENNESLQELFCLSPFSTSTNLTSKSMSTSELNTLYNNNQPSQLPLSNMNTSISFTSLSTEMASRTNSPRSKKVTNKTKRCKINVSKIYETFHKNIQRNQIELQFGLRFDDCGDWVDIELAKSCINVFIKYASALIANDNNYDLSNESVTGPVLVAAAFMVRQNPVHISFIRPIVQLAQNRQNDDGSNERENVNSIEHYISYIEYSVKMTKSDEFYHVRNDNRQSINLASQTLEKLKKIELKDIVSDENKLPIQLALFFETSWKKSITILAMLNDRIVLKASFLVRTHLKDAELKRKENAKKWYRLWRSLALNERAPWFDGIDEVPVRWRRDFSACHLTIPFKLKRDWLNEDKLRGGHSKSENLNARESIKEEKQIDQSNFKNLKGLYDCEVIKVTGTLKGKLYIYPELLSFVAEEKTKNIFLADIQDVFLRTRIHLPTAIEIFTINGRSYFLNFLNATNTQVMHKLSKLTLPNVRHFQLDDKENFFNIGYLTEKWASRKMSNFDYLLHLNLISGRSFNDLSQYPVFPWVLADYVSEKLDLSDPRVFRDLSKPVGALNDQKRIEIEERAAQIKEAEGKSYFYSSGFLYPNLVIDYLNRIEPFTSLHNKIYNTSFDYSLSTFQSVQKIWTQIMTKINDNWELIPEFYATPEFLSNLDDDRKSDTLLPPWSTSCFDFVYKMRKALESDFVSDHLNEWIDLIWGVKQHSAEDHNEFSPESYSDVWKSMNITSLDNVKTDDENSIESIKVSLLNMSQIPPQLFIVPHPVRQLPHRLNPNWMIFSYQTEIQNVTAAYFTKELTKLTVILMTSQMNKVHKYCITNRPKETKRKSDKKSRLSRVKSTFDIKSRFTQLFEVTVISKDIKKKFTQATLDQKFIFSFIEPSTVVFSASGSSEISFVNAATGTFSEISTPLSETRSIDASGGYFVVACRNSVVNVYKLRNSIEKVELKNASISEKTVSLTNLDFLDEKMTLKEDFSVGISSSNFFQSKSISQIGSIASYRSKLPCVAISETFNLIVNGTSDGFIVISSLTRLAVENIVSLGEDAKPVLISISPSWGLIVVHTFEIKSGIVTNFLLIFNVNGKLISKTKVDFSVTCMLAFTDSSSFDHIILADSTGVLFISDIYELDFSKPLYRCHDKVINLYYCNDDSRIIAVSSNGKIFLIAHDFF